MEDLTIAPADMTDQQVFDEVVRRLAAQGVPGLDAKNGVCCYENGEGDRCAIGVLLKREHIDAIRAGNCDGSPDLLPAPILRWLGYAGREDLFESIQGAHDIAVALDWDTEWRDKFRAVAKKHYLAVSALDEPGAA